MAGLNAWLNVSPALVVNRPRGGCDCLSLPYVRRLLQVTYRTREDKAGLKSDGLERSGDRAMEAISGHCTSGILAYVIGEHVLAFGSKSSRVSLSTDVKSTRLDPWELPLAQCKALVLATKSLGLTMAGWDLALDETGDYWCCGVRSQPDFHQSAVRHSVAAALISLFRNEDRLRPSHGIGDAPVA